MMVCIPRVAMKGGTFSMEITMPLTAPKPPMMIITMTRATGHGISGIQENMRAE